MGDPIAIWICRLGYALLATSAVLAGLAVFYYAKSRRATFYAAREKALRRAGRWMLAAMAVLASGMILLLLTACLNALRDRPLSSPSHTPTLLSHTPTLLSHTPTLLPTAPTPTRRPTATPPPIPSATSAIPPPEAALTPLPAATPAGPGARITLVTLAADRDENGQPLNPGAEFPPGNRPVYLFIAYEGLENGVAWTFAVYREGEYLDSSTQLWEWGPAGRTYLSYTPPGGYTPGIYELRLFIETRLQGVAQFVVKK